MITELNVQALNVSQSSSHNDGMVNKPVPVKSATLNQGVKKLDFGKDSPQTQGIAANNVTSIESRLRQNTTPVTAPQDEELAASVKSLNEFVQYTRREINFSVNDDTGRTVVKVIDHETKEVIRQFPPEEILAIAARMREEVEGEKGNLLEQKA